MIDMKTFLGLAMPNQFSLTVRESKYQAGCGGNKLGPKSPNFHDPCAQYCMIKD